MILVVGNLRRWERAGRDIPRLDGFEFAGFQEMTAALIEDVRPDVVLSALVDEGFDAVELARVLHGLGFAGRYRAVSAPLPDPGSVLAEVRLAAPTIDFDIFVLGRPS